MYNSITKGDNTQAFGNSLLRAYLNNPMGYEISKAEFQCGKVLKTFENPIFPFDINLTGAETKILNYQNECSMALWDKYGRKITAEGNFTLYAENERVLSPDTPIENIPQGEGQQPIRVDFDFCQEGLDVVLTIEAKPRYTSDLINDSGFINNQAQNLVYYTKTADMNALLNLKANQTNLDQTNATVSNLSTTVTENYNTLNNKIDTVNQELTGDIDQLDTKIDNVEETLQGNINTLSDTVSSNYTTLEGQITAESTARNQAIANHNADETAHPFIQNLVTLEVTDRENAVNDLQEQIDAIVASSDVKDYVNTHAELLQYDTSTLGNRDIIVVLSDETHNNATSYYRWITANNAFSYIGSIGPFATPGEVAEGYVPKTRQINGKPLSTDISLDAEDVGALPSSTVIPTVNNGKLTINVNDETEAEFTANQSANTTLNIDIPTQVSELINDANYVKNTNYATTSTGGVIKTALTAGNSVDSNGVLQGVIRTQQQYNTDANVMMISKGTLENIKESLVTSIADTKYESKLDVQLLEGAVL